MVSYYFLNKRVFQTIILAAIKVHVEVKRKECRNWLKPHGRREFELYSQSSEEDFSAGSDVIKLEF